MNDIEKLKSEVEIIKERNKRVEKDKQWETSLTRKITIATSTYFLIAIFLIVIKVEKPFISAFIPALAYLISTATLRFLKQKWQKGKNAH